MGRPAAREESTLTKVPFWVSAPFCLIVAVLGAVLLGLVFSKASPDGSLIGVSHNSLCGIPKDRTVVALNLFATQSLWLAMLVLESVAAAFALIVAINALKIAFGASGDTRTGWFFCIVLGVIALALDA